VDPLDVVQVDGVRYVSELLFIFQVMYEHEELQWNDIDRGKLLIRQSDFSGNPPAAIS
jgi:hypothetical protein